MFIFPYSFLTNFYWYMYIFSRIVSNALNYVGKRIALKRTCHISLKSNFAVERFEADNFFKANYEVFKEDVYGNDKMGE